MSTKIRKIKHRTKKFFGFPEDKWARGSGKNGYARSYGKFKNGGSGVDLRTKTEIKNADERRDEQ